MLTTLETFLRESHSLVRILFLIVVLFGLQLMLRSIRRLGGAVSSSRLGHVSKARTVASLATSTLSFAAYFLAAGLLLRELGVSLKAYLTSASILGLAIGFGSQGIVQDVVTGVTLVFSDLLDVGDMVEISGQAGIVKSIGMRFTVLENPLGALVYVPNRTIANVTNYPRGYQRCLVDLALPGDAEAVAKIEALVETMVTQTVEQLPGILRAPPSIEGRVRQSSGRELLRIKFRLWPGRGTPIENNFRSELLASIQKLVPEYQPWMISVNYEIEKGAVLYEGGRRRRT